MYRYISSSRLYYKRYFFGSCNSYRYLQIICVNHGFIETSVLSTNISYTYSYGALTAVAPQFCFWIKLIQSRKETTTFYHCIYYRHVHIVCFINLAEGRFLIWIRSSQNSLLWDVSYSLFAKMKNQMNINVYNISSQIRKDTTSPLHPHTRSPKHFVSSSHPTILDFTWNTCDHNKNKLVTYGTVVILCCSFREQERRFKVLLLPYCHGNRFLLAFSSSQLFTTWSHFVAHRVPWRSPTTYTISCHLTSIVCGALSHDDVEPTANLNT